MIQEVQQPVKEKVFCKSQEISVQNLISMLSGICENRYHAIKAYPAAYGATRKFEAIALIRSELKAAKDMMNDRQSVKTCLRLERSFMVIAPHSTKKLLNTYEQKVGGLMNACRIYLGLIKQ